MCGQVLCCFGCHDLGPVLRVSKTYNMGSEGFASCMALVTAGWFGGDILIHVNILNHYCHSSKRESAHGAKKLCYSLPRVQIRISDERVTPNVIMVNTMTGYMS